MLNLFLIFLILIRALSDDPLFVFLGMFSEYVLVFRVGLGFYNWTKKIDEPIEKQKYTNYSNKNVALSVKSKLATQAKQNSVKAPVKLNVKNPATKTVINPAKLPTKAPIQTPKKNEDFVFDLSEYVDSYIKDKK